MNDGYTFYPVYLVGGALNGVVDWYLIEGKTDMIYYSGGKDWVYRYANHDVILPKNEPGSANYWDGAVTVQVFVLDGHNLDNYLTDGHILLPLEVVQILLM